MVSTKVWYLKILISCADYYNGLTIVFFTAWEKGFTTLNRCSLNKAWDVNIVKPHTHLNDFANKTSNMLNQYQLLIDNLYYSLLKPKYTK